MSECLDDNLALELIEGKLASARRTTAERHIESCASCRELVVALARNGTGAERPLDAQRAAPARVGPYRIERPVGSGAAGTVYRAVDERSGEVVALKLVADPGWRARFGREVETLARLVHPGIVRYIAHGETPQGLYLAMEWLDGEDLGRCMDRGPIPWPSVRLLGLRLGAALAHAHSLGAVHRDIGPRNVFLPGGRLEHAKLLDFGLVRIPDGLDRTASQTVLGTPHYMAPEQVKDPRTVDARADLFSLGIVFFEALSGKRPFEGDDLFTVWRNIVEQPTPNLRALAPTVPESFVLLVERMLAKDPAQRPASAAVIHEALVRLDAPTSSDGNVSTAVTPPLRMEPPRPTAPPPVYAPPTYVAAAASGPHPPPIPPPLAPPRTGSSTGVILLAAGLVAGAIVLLGAALVVGPHLLTDSRLIDGKSKPVAKTSDDELPDDEPTVKPPSASPPSGPDRFFCGGDGVERVKGGRYEPRKDFPDEYAVFAGADCKAVLEDCVVGGKSSVFVGGDADLTLRRCKVSGTILVGGDAKLTFDGTTFTKKPTVLNKGRFVSR